MSTFQFVSIVSRLIAISTCTALAILVISQLRHDTKSRLFGLLMINIAIVASLGTVSRLATTLHYGDIAAFQSFSVASAFTAFVPLIVFIFATEYLESWTRWRRWIARVLFVNAILVAILCLTDHAFASWGMSEDGYLTYKLTPLLTALIIAGDLGMLLIPQLVIEQYRKKRHQTNARMLLGFILLCIGFFLISIEILNRYAAQIIVWTVASIVIAGPVLQQRLFDPLAQLNVKLTHRAEQLNLINRVGQQANSTLQLDPLLTKLTAEIRHLLGHYSVTVFIIDERDDGHLVARATASNSIPSVISATPFIKEAAQSGKITYCPDTSADLRFSSSPHSLSSQSEVALPLTIGNQENASTTLIGVLHIESEVKNGFTPDDLEVLDILGQQLAAAIHNASLFEEAERQRTIAVKANAAKTQFLAAMGHDLRTPLQAILGCNFFMQNPQHYGPDVTINTAFREDLEQTEVNARQLLRLINNVLDLSRIEAGAIDLVLKPIHPTNILAQAQQASKALLKPNVEMKALYPDDLPRIRADDLRLNQILWNLLSNACKFTESETITIDTRVNNNKLEFIIADTGTGIPSDAQASLFTQFRQADPDIARQYGGSGLGLTICKQLIELHGGTIWFESAKSKGATFHFTIPLSSPETDIATDLNETEANKHIAIFSKPTTSTLKQVLILDTAKNKNWDRLSAALTPANYRLLFSTNATHALRLAKASRPALIVTIVYPTTPLSIREIASQLVTDPNFIFTTVMSCTPADDTDWLQTLISSILQAGTHPTGSSAVIH